MKPLKISTFFSFILLASFTTLGQKIRVKEGDRDVLKNETTVNIELTYENMSVGKYNKEQDYINAKKGDYNKKEPGKGDTWAKRWEDDKESKFEPNLKDLFEQTSNMKISRGAKYTLIFHTTSIEPGFDIGFTRKSANIDAEVTIVETANKSKVVTKLTLEKAPGRTFFGNDYDTGERISEAYARAGKELARYLK
jgi:hypothetical protein